MKKLIAAVLLFAGVLSLILPLSAEVGDPAENPAFTIVVGLEKEELSTSDLPRLPYYDGNSLMVPLRKISEALGYKVDWNAQTGAITIEDEYIQKATLYNGTENVIFEGKLKVINMSREIENEAKTAVHNGVAYVPLAFFKEFFNDTSINETVISISPSMAELAN